MPRRWPCGSSRRSWDRHRQPGRGSSSASTASRAARRSAHGRWRRTSTRPTWSATPSSSNGLPAPARSRSSPKWTRRPGGRSTRPGRSCTRRRCRCWTPCPRSSKTAMPSAPRTGQPPARQARSAIRAGEHTGPTAHLAPGCVQANLVVLPRAAAEDFITFAERNPKPCPIVEVIEHGTEAVNSAPGSDLRTDVPRYRRCSSTESTPTRPPTPPHGGETTWCRCCWDAASASRPP